MPKIVIMAGGTGGHVYPGIAVAEELKSRDWHVEWFGTQERMEAQAVPNAGFPINFLKVKGVRGKGLIGKLLSPFMLIKALFQSISLLRRIKPDMVLGMGGYASGPGGIAAKLLGIPLIVHEQNAVFGMTNRYLAKIATRVLCGFDVKNSSFSHQSPPNIEYVGNPVRKAFTEARKAQDQNTTSIEEKPSNLLILGGSLGALALNQSVPKTIADLPESLRQNLSIVHQAGKGKAALPQGLYGELVNAEVVEFIDDVAAHMNRADLIICRAGALTVAEITTMSKPAIFVPLPIAVDDHQTYNAQSLTEHGAAILIKQQNIETELLMVLQTLFQEPSKLNDMSKQARLIGQQDSAIKVADICEQIIG